jgi:tellurite resistance protein
MAIKLTLDGPQAGLLLAASVSLADDEPSPAEIAVLKKYFLAETAVSLESRFAEAAVAWPRDREILEPAILSRLKEATPAFRARSLAVALEVSEADGRVDQDEMRLLARYADALGLSLADAERYRKASLREAESASGYGDFAEADSSRLPLEAALGPREAIAALTALVAAADDDPSEAEAALLREYCSAADFESLAAAMKAAGGAWPGDLGRLRPSIVAGLRAMSRARQLAALTLAYRTARADGALDPAEAALLKDFCVELQIGFGELEACAPALESLFRSA